jgi:hypothetical protein
MKDYINTSQTDAIARLEFRVTHWMQRETKLSPKSIKNYTQAIRKIARDFYLNDSLPSIDLGACSSEQLTELKKLYFAVQKFKELDTRGKGMYSAAFNKLILAKASVISTGKQDASVINAQAEIIHNWTSPQKNTLPYSHFSGTYKEWKEGKADSFIVKIGSIGGRRM